MVVETIGQAISLARPVGMKHRTPNKSLFMVKGQSFKVTNKSIWYNEKQVWNHHCEQMEIEWHRELHKIPVKHLS